jgi:hypothetical protein
MSKIIEHNGRTTTSQEEKDALMDQAAAKLAELDGYIAQRDQELHRIYEICSVFHSVVVGYLKSGPLPEDDEQQAALDLVADAVYAIENVCTLAEAGLIRREEGYE